MIRYEAKYYSNHEIELPDLLMHLLHCLFVLSLNRVVAHAIHHAFASGSVGQLVGGV